MGKTALEKEKTFSLKMTPDEHEKLTTASSKLKALLRTMHDSLHSGNEVEPGDLSWLFMYAETELTEINKVVEGFKQSS